ncbi:hypothetical protein RHMOL_Rhmol03G0291800 [Rhododendron molle]|uniref:Uncharacterized protein n=1 Tax=Rhododendron molle TaxID=49168 RepID=A0ACC0PL03_RHOML|nr:hypothetical protein RHMOL_Rhmol03G0291800 [Rhododendron molle]
MQKTAAKFRNLRPDAKTAAKCRNPCPRVKVSGHNLSFSRRVCVSRVSIIRGQKQNSAAKCRNPRPTVENRGQVQKTAAKCRNPRPSAEIRGQMQKSAARCRNPRPRIFPIHVMGIARSLVTLVSWFGSWAVSYTFNFLMSWSSTGTFFVDAAFSAQTILFVAKTLVERITGQIVVFGAYGLYFGKYKTRKGKKPISSSLLQHADNDMKHRNKGREIELERIVERSGGGGDEVDVGQNGLDEVDYGDVVDGLVVLVDEEVEGNAVLPEILDVD